MSVAGFLQGACPVQRMGIDWAHAHQRIVWYSFSVQCYEAEQQIWFISTPSTRKRPL
jgi:hypothetical protein